MPHRQATILVIDDDAVIREVVCETLRQEGYRAVTAASHAEALRHLAAFRYALILADTEGATTRDPWPSLEAVRAAAAGTPVFIFSAHLPRSFAGYAERGFAGVISKPFDLDELLATLSKALSGRQWPTVPPPGDN